MTAVSDHTLLIFINLCGTPYWTAPYHPPGALAAGGPPGQYRGGDQGNLPGGAGERGYLQAGGPKTVVRRGLQHDLATSWPQYCQVIREVMLDKLLSSSAHLGKTDLV